MSERINFSSGTRDVVAARAGYRCSIPNCGRVTIGPDLAGDKFVETGVAAHIFSASPRGPRGQGGLEEDQLASPANAIWLCEIHGKVVDSNRGASYPPALLQSYKSLQEAKAAREYQGLHQPVYWFQELTIHRSAIFEDNTKLRFGKLTLVVGPNSSGKSALGDWLTGFGAQTQLWRWMPQPKNTQSLDVELRYLKPDAQTVRMSIQPTSVIDFEVDGRKSPVQPLPMRFVFLREDHAAKSMHELDDVELICQRLNIDPLALPGLLPHVGINGLGFASNLRLTRENTADDGEAPKPEWRLRGDVKGTSPGLRFRGLSTGEQVLVLLEIAVALARVYAEHVPTMLILDQGMDRFSSEFFAHLAEHLAAAQASFQTIIVLPYEPKDTTDGDWKGWSMIRLHRRAGPTGKTTIAQDPF